MHPVVVFDSISFLGSLTALILLLKGWKRALQRDIKLLLTGLLAFVLFYNFCLILEWSGITKAFDTIEDFVGALVPMWWAFVFYAFFQETASRDLRESEERYRRLVRQSKDAIFQVGLDGNITFASPACQAILGYGPRELISDPNLFLRIVHPYHHQQFDAFWKEYRSKGIFPERLLEWAWIHKDGHTVFTENVFTNLFDAHGSLMGFQTIARDITERRRAEEALRASQERYWRLWDDAPVAYHRLDTKGIVLQVNQTEMNMLGYAKDEMVGKPIFEFVQPDQRKDAEERFKRKLAGVDVPQQYDRIYVKKDGSSICVSIDDRLERDAEGQVVGIRTTMVDVSKRRQAEDALRESEKKYSTLVENSLTGIYIDQDEKIVFANNRFAAMYGYEREELIGIETRWLVHPEDRPMTETMRKRRLNGEDVPNEYEARGLTKAGKTIWVNRRNSRIEYQGRPAILGNIVDITEQKKAEEELLKINKELKNFVDVVSHDLKTPIVAIQGFSSRLFKKYQEKLGDKGGRYLKLINTSARRMEGLVTDLLALSSIGKVLSTFKDVSSIEIVANVTTGLQDKLKENRIELVVAEDLPHIYCDGERIYQVFENLIVNAIKYMGDTENPKIEIGYDDNGAFHQFYVRDNGIGIDAKYHGKVFEMFHRLREVEDEKGTGLGLVIVDRIVNNHGGRVWVESEKGKGAVFYFTLPKADPIRLP